MLPLPDEIQVFLATQGLTFFFCDSRSLHGPQSGGFFDCTLRDAAAQPSTLRSIVQSMTVTVRSTLRSLYRRERDYLQRYFAQTDDATDLATVVRHMRRLVTTALAGDSDTVPGTNGKGDTSDSQGWTAAVLAEVAHDGSTQALPGNHERTNDRCCREELKWGGRVASAEQPGGPQCVDAGAEQLMGVPQKNKAGPLIEKPSTEDLKKSMKKAARRLHPRANMRNILKVRCKQYSVIMSGLLHVYGRYVSRAGARQCLEHLAYSHTVVFAVDVLRTDRLCYRKAKEVHSGHHDSLKPVFSSWCADLHEVHRAGMGTVCDERAQHIAEHIHCHILHESQHTAPAA